jgi:hypothetical protein
VVTVNNDTDYTGILSTSVTDRPVSRTWIGKGQINEAYLNDDMTGVFVLDEYLSAETTSAIVGCTVPYHDSQDTCLARSHQKRLVRLIFFCHCEYETKLNCSHERETDKESVREKMIDRETNLTSICEKNIFTVCLPPI